MHLAVGTARLHRRLPARARRPRATSPSCRQAAATVRRPRRLVGAHRLRPSHHGDGRAVARRVILCSLEIDGDPRASPLRRAAPQPHRLDHQRRLHPIMRLIRIAFVVVSIVALPAVCPAHRLASGTGGAKAQPRPGGDAARRRPEPGGEIKAVTQAILEEIDKRSELMANIEYLCDMIGPRLTGSPDLTKANQWTRDKFQQYGLANASSRAVDDRAGLDARRGQGPGGRAGRAADPPGIGRLEPLDQGPAARAGGPRQGPVGRRAEPLQGEAQGGLGPPRRGLGPALAQAAAHRTWTARCGGGCATSRGCGSSARSSRSSWSPKGPPGSSVDSNKEHGLVNMTTAA